MRMSFILTVSLVTLNASFMSLQTVHATEYINQKEGSIAFEKGESNQSLTPVILIEAQGETYVYIL